MVNRSDETGSDRPVVAAGGANIDITARCSMQLANGSSNPGTVVRSVGGVARNIAENLARLATPVQLVAAVGVDAFGDLVLAETRSAGVDVSMVRRAATGTGAYVAVLDACGELVAGVADMASTDALGPGTLAEAVDAIAASSFLVLDANLPNASIDLLWAAASVHDVPVVIDPVSDAKATRIASLLGTRTLHTLTPNRSELAALTAMPAVTDGEVVAAAEALHRRGIAVVWVRLGAAGSLVSMADRGHIRLHTDDRSNGQVVDVTGAGDAMTAAYVHGLALGLAPMVAVDLGQAAAAATVAVRATVRADLRSAIAPALRAAGLPALSSVVAQTRANVVT